MYIAIGIILVVLVLIYIRYRSEKRYMHTFYINGKPHTVDVRKLPPDDEINQQTEDMEREIEKLRQSNREWEIQFSELAKFQREGIECEKSGDTEGAISNYRQAVEYGETAPRMQTNNFLYSMERLMILYRKQKDYVSEIQVIEKALSRDLTDKDRDRFTVRLEKAKKLNQRDNE